MEGGLAPVACGFGGESKKGKAAEVWIPLEDDETDEEVDTDVSGGEGQRLAAYASLTFHIFTPLYYAYNALGPGLLCDSKVVRFGSSQLMSPHQLSTQKVNTICSLA